MARSKRLRSPTAATPMERRSSSVIAGRSASSTALVQKGAEMVGEAQSLQEAGQPRGRDRGALARTVSIRVV